MGADAGAGRMVLGTFDYPTCRRRPLPNASRHITGSSTLGVTIVCAWRALRGCCETSLVGFSLASPGSEPPKRLRERARAFRSTRDSTNREAQQQRTCPDITLVQPAFVVLQNGVSVSFGALMLLSGNRGPGCVGCVPPGDAPSVGPSDKVTYGDRELIHGYRDALLPIVACEAIQ